MQILDRGTREEKAVRALAEAPLMSGEESNPEISDILIYKKVCDSVAYE